jgi:hypothetical protein
MIPRRLSKSLVKGLAKSGQFYNPWGMMGYGMSPWGMMGYGMPSWGMVPPWGNMGQAGQQGGPNPWQAYAQQYAAEASLWAQRPSNSYTVDFQNVDGKVVAVVTNNKDQRFVVPTTSTSIRGAINQILSIPEIRKSLGDGIASFAVNTPHGVSVYRFDRQGNTSQMTIPRHMLNTNYGRYMLSMATGDGDIARELSSTRKREIIDRTVDPRTGEVRWSVDVRRVEGIDEEAFNSYRKHLSDLYAAAHELRMDRIRGGVMDHKKREELQKRMTTAIESLKDSKYISDETANALQQHAQSYIQGDERFGIDYSVDRFRRFISGIAQNPHLYHRDASEFINNPEQWLQLRQQAPTVAAVGSAAAVAANSARTTSPSQATTTGSPTTTTPAPNTAPGPRQPTETARLEPDMSRPKTVQAAYNGNVIHVNTAHSFTEDVDRMLADRLAIIVEDLIKLPTV